MCTSIAVCCDTKFKKKMEKNRNFTLFIATREPLVKTKIIGFNGLRFKLIKNDVNHRLKIEFMGRGGDFRFFLKLVWK